MAIDAEDLIIQPFKELIQRGNEAVQNAQGSGEDIDDCQHMLKVANSVVKEGERALNKIQPLWTSQTEKYGNAFLSAISDNDTISKSRVALDDLLYDFDDFIEVDSFDADKFTDIQAAAKSFARIVIETIKRLRIEEPEPVLQPPTPVSAAAQLVFPPLPPLPPSAQRPRALRLSSPVEDQAAGDEHVSTVLAGPLRRGANSIRSNGSAFPSRNGTRRSQVSYTASNAEIQSARRMRVQRTSPVDTDTSQHHALEPLTPEEISGGRPQNMIHAESRDVTTVSPGWTTPRTTAWVNEQVDSDERQTQRSTTPEEAPTNMRASRYTNRSSERTSSVFDGPTSPSSNTNRTSAFSSHTSELSYRYIPAMPPLPSIPQHGERLEILSPTGPVTPPASIKHVAAQAPPGAAFDTGLILAGEDFEAVNIPTQPTWYSNEANCSIEPSSSLYQMGGFCKGAHLFSDRGMEAGTKSSYEYTSQTYEAQCVDCEYRQDMAKLLADMKKSPKANFRTADVRYRLRFLYKSHIMTNVSEFKQYGCLFCAHEGRTTREGDATVFGSPDRLFTHLAQHTQPLPPVDGIKVLYGKEAELIDKELCDYDLHLPEPPVKSGVPEDEVARLSRLPVAQATKRHDAGSEELGLAGADGKQESALQFYAGARIVGVEFLEKWDGKWCIGWHDGIRGYFPSKLIELVGPAGGEVRLPGMNADGITVKARWKWAPKEGGVGWLSFKANDTISNVSWTFQDQWCWSGMTKNGKVGFFPQSHIKPESIRDAIGTSSSTASITSGKTTKPSKTAKLFGSRRAATRPMSSMS